MIEVKLADHLGVFRTAALHAVTDVENHQTVAPVSEIGQPILNLQIMKIPAPHLIAFTGFDYRSDFIRHFPARDLFWILNVSKIYDAHRSGSIIRQVDVMAVHEGAVHAARDCRGVFGDWLGMRRIGVVIEGDAVLAIRSALARAKQEHYV